MESLLDRINSAVWGSGLIVLLLLTSLSCLLLGHGSIRKSLRSLRRHDTDKPQRRRLLQSCTTSLAAAMGTGNLIGVAAALTLGGPGAIFWMWVAAACGMVLIYAENVLAGAYQSETLCGAAAYLRLGLQSPRLAAAFCIFCTAASFGMGNMTQTNAMAQTMEAAFAVPPLLTGILAAVIAGGILLGGARRIGQFTQMMIPLLSLLYLGMAGVVLFRFREQLPAVFGSIFREAFGVSAVCGGFTGAAVQRAVSVGIRRGIFSNEAGLGSSGILHSGAQDTPPGLRGLIGMAEVIADTFLCCTVTALVILCTGAEEGDGGVLLLCAFRKGLGSAADILLPPVIALFALCTLIGWGCCGGKAFASLTKGKHLRTYYLVFCTAAVIGAVMQLRTVWTIADIANGCMAYCNLPALLLLYPAVTAKQDAA